MDNWLTVVRSAQHLSHLTFDRRIRLYPEQLDSLSDHLANSNNPKLAELDIGVITSSAEVVAKERLESVCEARGIKLFSQ